MSVATMERKSNKKASSTEPPAPRPIETIKVELANAQAELNQDLEGNARYGGGIVDEDLVNKVTGLQSELDLQLARQIPEPAVVMAAPKPIDADIFIEAIEVAANHRELEHEAETIRLARTIKEMGLLQPVAVRAKDAVDVPSNGRLRCTLIYGSRRLAAVKLNGDNVIRARIYSRDVTDDQVEMMRSIENLQRAELTPVERALAIAMTIDQVRKRLAEPIDGDNPRNIHTAVDTAGGVEAYVGQWLGQDAAWVRDHGYVAKLGGEARKLLSAGRLTLGHARELAKIADPVVSDQIAQDAAQEVDGTGGQNVATLARQVSLELRSLKTVKWPLDVSFGLLKQACAGCPHNTQSQPLLFEHDGAEALDALNAKAGTCMHAACFASKEREVEKAISTNAPKVAKMDDIGHTPAALVAEGKVPKVVKPEVFSRQVKKITDPPAKKSTSSGFAGGRAEAKDPLLDACKKYETQRNAWGEKISKAVIDKIKKKPGAVTIAELLNRGDDIGLMRPSFYTYGETGATANEKYLDELAKIKKTANQNRIITLVRGFASPTMETIAELEKGDTIYGPERVFHDLEDSLLIELAAAAGVKHDPPPDRDAILAVATAKAEKADKKPAKKKAGGGKAAKPAEDVDAADEKDDDAW